MRRGTWPLSNAWDSCTSCGEDTDGNLHCAECGEAVCLACEEAGLCVACYRVAEEERDGIELRLGAIAPYRRPSLGARMRREG